MWFLIDTVWGLLVTLLVIAIAGILLDYKFIAILFIVVAVLLATYLYVKAANSDQEITRG